MRLPHAASRAWPSAIAKVVRLQKYLAEAGVASRRAAEEIILAGRVAVNGEKIAALGARVDPLHDQVAVDGKPLRARRKQYVALHKPRGLVCTRSDELGRATVYELLPKEWAHLNLVGRLDYNSEGLIFLTNDGEFSLRLTHPRYGVRKKYHVTVEGRVEPETLRKFTQGIVYLGDKLKAENGAQLLNPRIAYTVRKLVK